VKHEVDGVSTYLLAAAAAHFGPVLHVHVSKQLFRYSKLKKLIPQNRAHIVSQHGATRAKPRCYTTDGHATERSEVCVCQWNTWRTICIEIRLVFPQTDERRQTQVLRKYI